MRLADTEAACLYWGCSRRALFKWASERRIRRHGTAARRLWDLDALPPAVPGEPLPKPPRKGVIDV